jgi:NADPH:quinone reductase-like Zn-dependent oxidoreductase/acyl carrier protein
LLVSPDPLAGVLAVAGNASDRAVAGQTAGASHALRLDHPWLADVMHEPGGVVTYVSHFETTQWVLDEHRPLGRAVLPGTAYLELARAALAGRDRDRPVQLSDVYFLAPLVVEDGESREVRTLLKPRDAGFEFVVASRITAGRDEWIEHARGEIGFLDTAAPPACRPADIARGWDATGAAHAEDVFARRAGNFPPHWRCCEALRIGSGEGLATLRLAPAFAAETATFALHPALADMATGFLSVVDGFERGVPFRYQRVRLWRPLSEGVHSHVRARADDSPQQRSYDATVVDDSGDVLLEVIGFTLKELDVARAGETAALPEAQRNVCVDIEHPGSLKTLGLRQQRRRAPGPGEVEIEVAAAGLNFIEVLYALGMLPEPPGGDVTFGLECAGRVAALGAGVAGLKPGDPVYGFAARAFSRYATTAAATIAPMPAQLSFAQAATLPAAYTTAYYALITRGRLRRGERVLIHAASGGVGLAAVNIARWRGAEIYATAGTPDKRDHLKGLGIRHVFDSRSLDFARQVLDATQGRGVDVLLNSLGGEFIAAGLSALGRHGRFLELGKRDILRDSALHLAPFEKHLAFIALDVGTDLPEFPAVWQQVVRAIGRQAWQPLPYREFPMQQVADAFEYMAQGRHIGKVLVLAAGAEADPARSRRVRGRPLGDIMGRGAATASAAGTDATHRRPALTSTYRAPGGATESTIVAIWQELLGVAGIGADDNFFELRGDSLLAAQVTSRLYAAFRVKLPLSSVFEQPTAAGLASRVERLRESLRELETAPSTQPGSNEVEHEL